jgi:hypothetical protein
MPGGGGTDVGSVLSYSWNKFTQNIGEWIILWLILLGIAIASYFLLIVASAIGSTAGSSTSSFGLGLRFNLVGILFSVILGAIQGVMLVVVAKGAAMAVNGQRVDVGACFKLTTNNILAGVIFGLVQAVLNYIFCGFGGIVAWLFIGFLPVLSALDDKGADALGESVSLSTSRASESMVYWLIGWFISGCLCFLGAPISMIGGAYLVKRFRGEPIAP